MCQLYYCQYLAQFNEQFIFADEPLLSAIRKNLKETKQTHVDGGAFIQEPIMYAEKSGMEV